MLLPLLFTIKISVYLVKAVGLFKHNYTTIGYIKTCKRYHECYEQSYEVLRYATRCYMWYYETLRGATSGTTKYYEVLRVVLQVTTRCHRWYQEVLQGTTSCTASHYVVLREVKVQRVVFQKHYSKVIFQENRYEKFYKIHWKPTVIRVLALVRLEPYANGFTE